MRRRGGIGRRLAPVLGIAIAACAGCLEMDTTVHIGADGSGWQRTRLVMGDSMQATVRSASGVLDPEGSGSDPFAVFERRKVERELEEVGLHLRAHRTFDQRSGRGVELEVGFDDLTGLRRNPLSGGNRADWQLRAGEEPDQVRLVYYPRGEQAWKQCREQMRALAEQPDAVVAQLVARRRSMLRDLDVSWTLELPGRVVAHTANLTLVQGGRAVRAAVRTDDLRSADDLLRWTAPRFEVMVASRELRLLVDAAVRAAAATPAAARSGR